MFHSLPPAVQALPLSRLVPCGRRVFIVQAEGITYRLRIARDGRCAAYLPGGRV